MSTDSRTKAGPLEHVRPQCAWIQTVPSSVSLGKGEAHTDSLAINYHAV